MGNSNGKPATPGGTKAPSTEAAAAAGAARFDWGLPPEGPSEQELENLDELVLQTWASCKAKPVELKFSRSDEDEKARRDGLQWRKRSSFIELNCGEDSFFVANNYRAIGIADGVGGWREEGVDPALFPNELMRNAKLYAETHRSEADPEKVMNEAFERLKSEGTVKAGSSTFCCATLATKADEDGQKTYLDVANLGDGGCIIIRNHDVIQRVHEKVHGFNSPLQIAILPPQYKGKCYEDTVQDSVRETFEVRKGDVVVMGTDGMFDNRFCSQIAMDAGWVGDTQESVYDGIPLVGGMLQFILGSSHTPVEYTDPYRVVQRLVQDAYKTSLDKKADTPWADSLRYLGVEHAEGGKVDDITVLISKVTTRRELMESTMW